MEPRRQQQTGQSTEGRHEHPLPQEISEEQRNLNVAAHRAAEDDIQADPELSAHSPNDDLDEGETARLGEDVPV